MLNPYLSLEYSREHRQDLLAESSQQLASRQVARFARAARRAQRAEQRARVRAGRRPQGRPKTIRARRGSRGY
jgi:hypothetical protein